MAMSVRLLFIMWHIRAHGPAAGKGFLECRYFCIT